MRISTVVISIASLLSVAYATPLSDISEFSNGIIAGPLPYAKLVAEVEALKATTTLVSRDTGRALLGEGVYLCDDRDFKGACYYGSYPINTGIRPDAYWQARIQSAGPDKGGYCFFWDVDCNQGTSDMFSWPGGNLKQGIAKHLSCFYCHPTPGQPYH